MTVPVVPNIDDNMVDGVLEDVVEGGSGVSVGSYVVEEGDEEEEEMFFLVRRERRFKGCGDIPSFVYMGMMSIRGLVMSVINIVLEDVISEDFLFELFEISVMDVCVECSDEVFSVSLLVSLKVSLSVCFGISVSEDVSVSEGVSVGWFFSAVLMDIYVSSSMFRTDEVVVMSFVVFIGLTVLIILEVSGFGIKNLMGVYGVEILLGVYGTEILMGMFGTEILMGVAYSMDGSDFLMFDSVYNAVSVNVFFSGSMSMFPVLGFFLFLLNL